MNKLSRYGGAEKASLQNSDKEIFLERSHLEDQEVEGRMSSTRIKLLGLVAGMTGGRN